MYVVLGAAGLFKAQQMIVGSQEKKKAAQKLKELNLRTQDIIAIVISGLVLLVMFAAFILLGFLLFTSSLDSPASIGPALGMLGGGVQQAQKTSAKAQSQVGGAVEKIDTATVDQSELPSADVEAPEPDPVTLDAAPEEAAE
jgi:flagellar basal body-associated protein FliL